MMDGGINQFQINWLNGKDLVLEVAENFGLQNYQIASNGKDIAKFLKSIDESLAVYCQ